MRFSPMCADLSSRLPVSGGPGDSNEALPRSVDAVAQKRDDRSGSRSTKTGAPCSAPVVARFHAARGSGELLDSRRVLLLSDPPGLEARSQGLQSHLVQLAFGLHEVLVDVMRLAALCFRSLEV